MASILQSLPKTILTGSLLAVALLIMITGHYGGFDQLYWASLSRFLHVISGVMWIGLLYYFNFIGGGYLKQASPEAKKDMLQLLSLIHI